MNQPPKGIQDWVHALDSDVFKRWIRTFLGAAALIVITALYLLTEAKNFSNPEAMEMAQLGRNLAMGRGYTTHFIRPLSFQLLRERAPERGENPAGILQRPHPDLQNPPVYPVMIGVLFKFLPDTLRFGTPGDAGRMRPWPEQVITAMNLGWFGLGAWLLFRLGRRLFDVQVGAMAAALYGGTELIWRFSSNGLTTPFLMVLVLLLAEVLTRLDECGAELAPGVVPPLARPLWLAAAGGAILGIGFLTRYAFAWLLVPAVIWLLVTHVRRWGTVSVCLAVFALIAGPWVARNYHLSGRLLGTSYAVVASGTETFPETTLERHLKDPGASPDLREMRVKFAVNASSILRESLPRLTGNWVFFLFMAGLVLPFRNARLRRLRWFAVGSLGVLFLVEAMGYGYWSRLVPEVNDSNQMMLMAPLVFLFGTAVFFNLLDATEFGHPLFQRIIVGGAWVVFSLPLLTSILPPRSYPMVEPAYRPDIVREVCQYVGPGELVMSDLPWAVAWYGDRRCLWLPHSVRSENGEDFFAVYDFESPVAALYISPLTTETSLRQLGTRSSVWGWFYFDALMRGNLPMGFPLVHAYEGSAKAGHLFLTDRRRW